MTSTSSTILQNSQYLDGLQDEQALSAAIPYTPHHAAAHHSLNSDSFTVTTSSKQVYDIASNDAALNCYECLDEEDSNASFLEVPNVSSMTAKTLCSSNVPPSGIFRATLKRALSLVLLPPEWRDIPIQCVAGKTDYTDHRAFAGNYVAFFSEILKKFNGYCCWIFKKKLYKARTPKKEIVPLLAWLCKKRLFVKQPINSQPMSWGYSWDYEGY